MYNDFIFGSTNLSIPEVVYSSQTAINNIHAEKSQEIKFLYMNSLTLKILKRALKNLPQVMVLDFK